MSVNATIKKVDYINALNHTPSNMLKPMGGKKFFSALEAAFTSTHVNNTMKWFAESNASSVGMEDFNNRIWAALLDGEMISVDDQKYLADVVHKVSLGVL